MITVTTPRKILRIALAQLNPTVGDVAGNAAKVREARALSDADLHDRYHTFCDPRLNAEQALEVAFLTAELIKRERQGRERPRVEAAE